MRINPDKLDESFPIIVRYCGVVLTVVLVIASVLGHGVELAAGYVAAAGMILYKSVKGAATSASSDNNDSESNLQKTGRNENVDDNLTKDDRWSHMP